MKNGYTETADRLAAKESEEATLWTRLAEAVRPGRGEYLTDVVSLPSGGHVVGVYKTRASAPKAGTYWTTVFGGRSDHTYYPSVDLALLALLSRKGQDDPNVTRHAVRFLGRALNLPGSDEA